MTFKPITFLLTLSILINTASCISEEERLHQRQKLNYKWPPTSLVPNTPGWNRIMNRRFEQISHKITSREDKWNAWMAMVTSALVAKNYTENGWGLTRAPEHVIERLQNRLNATLLTSDDENTNNGDGSNSIIDPNHRRTRQEHFVPVIEGTDEARPLMIFNDTENRAILQELKPFFEWWSGIDLKPSIAYGIRAYRNNSNLLMHIDKPSTHVISGIFHVGRSDDAEPWPIVIEDFHGNTNQVYLTPGDVLFYESSKCFHGRPQTFHGGYYANVFLHYAPASSEFNGEELTNERNLAVPPHWHVDFPRDKEGVDEFTMVGTSFKEPECRNLLCALDERSAENQYLVNWYGPAKKGMVVTSGWDPVTMEPPREWVESGYDGGKRAFGGAGVDKEEEVKSAGGGTDEL